jgi:hypothetical protein
MLAFGRAKRGTPNTATLLARALPSPRSTAALANAAGVEATRSSMPMPADAASLPCLCSTAPSEGIGAYR